MLLRDLFVLSILAVANGAAAASNNLQQPSSKSPVVSSNLDDSHGELESRDIIKSNRCGPQFGRKCPDGRCCSTAGYCGVTAAHCRSPDCQIDYGRCDASASPDGAPTWNIPRPRFGNVPWGPNIVRSCTVPGTVALTFDDGPREYTSELLDLLDKYSAKVTFFITGNNGGKGSIDEPDHPWPKLIRRMHRSGHQIASHTWTHQDLSKITHEQRLEQLFKNEMALRNILGAFPTYIRPPYSSCLPESGCLSDLGDLGYHIVLYDLDTSDYSHDSPNAIQFSKDVFNKAVAPSKASDKSWLVIAHDVHEQTVHNLTEHMLRVISDHGYRAVTVGQCLNDPEEYWYREDHSNPARKDKDSKKKDLLNPNVKPSPNLKVSEDGTCGKGTTCNGSKTGPCCSKDGRCGGTTYHCSSDCQPDFGRCYWPGSSTLLPNGSTIGSPRYPQDTKGGWVPIDDDGDSRKTPVKSEASLLNLRKSVAALALLVSIVVLFG